MLRGVASNGVKETSCVDMDHGESDQNVATRLQYLVSGGDHCGLRVREKFITGCDDPGKTLLLRKMGQMVGDVSSVNLLLAQLLDDVWLSDGGLP
jgi:hypothetical protein